MHSSAATLGRHIRQRRQTNSEECTHAYWYVTMSPLSFDNRLMDRNADCCVNTVHEKITTATNLVNFGPVTPEILWLICMGGESRYRLKYDVLWF